MASVSIYLNFPNNTEEAFNHYRRVFGTEFEGDITRFSDVPPSDDMPPLSETSKKLVMHVSLPILGGFRLMGTDAPEEMGFQVTRGNHVYINLEPDTRAETKRLFDLLATDGTVEQELQEMFWGAYYGSCTDRFGIRWMFNCSEK